MFLQTLEDRIVKTQKELKRLKGAMQSMKSNNKFDKSISQKHFMIMRAERELKWLKSIKPRQRRMLNFSLQATEKSSLEVLDFHKAHLHFDGMKRPILHGLDVGVRRGQKIGVVGPNGAGKTSISKSNNGGIKVRLG